MYKRSCAFCMDEERDALEESLLNGHISPKQLDKDKSWRLGTTERHWRNHMGEFHLAANSSCPVCTSPQRAAYEELYFNTGNSDLIAQELEVGENVVYQHMKNHFQPLVQKTAAIEVALRAGTVSRSKTSCASKTSGVRKAIRNRSIKRSTFCKLNSARKVLKYGRGLRRN